MFCYSQETYSDKWDKQNKRCNVFAGKKQVNYDFSFTDTVLQTLASPQWCVSRYSLICLNNKQVAGVSISRGWRRTTPNNNPYTRNGVEYIMTSDKWLQSRAAPAIC